MARHVQTRFEISGKLVALTPLHIGGASGADCDTDMPLCVNGKGDYYVPGTSMAGAFRDWMFHRFDLSIVQALWGFQDKNKPENGYASHITVDDGVVDNALPAEIRDGVGIDRVSGTAADRAKYDIAILPRGSQIDLNLRVDLGRELAEADARALLLCLIDALEKGEIRLGAAKTRGMGKVKLEKNSVTETRLGSRDGLLTYLKQGKEICELGASASELHPQPQPRIEVEVQWQPSDALMVKSGREGVGVDMLPLVSGDGNELALVIPGSSIKGALRAQAERILRTVWNKPGDIKSPLLDRLDELELIQVLFGSRKKRSSNADSKSDGAANPESRQKKKADLGRGALYIDDCFATSKVNPAKWQAVETAESVAEVVEKLADAGFNKVDLAFHVAIDRWLGGAAENYLYTNLEPRYIEWEPICINLNLSQIDNELRLPAEALMQLLIRDLRQERIQLGFGGNRGMGSIEVKDVKWNRIDWDTNKEIQSHWTTYLEGGCK